MLILANVGVAVTLLVGAAGFGYVRYRLDSIKTVAAAGLSTTDGNPAVDHADGLSPENILIIGNETRAGQTMVNSGNPALLTGTLSDVIMILHLDPAKRSASLLSIPRDVFAPMPAGSEVGPYEKIDAALNDGKAGANNLITAITDDFGIKINHYVEVDFDGFLQMVDALGGIKVDFPELIYDAQANLQIVHTGCQLVDGAEALALVRSRHLQYDPPGVNPDDPPAWPSDPESDLSRIARDHTIVRILGSTAESEGLSNPLKANAFLGAVLGSITVDPGLKNQLLALAAHYGSLDTAAVPETTFPVTQVLGPDNAGYSYDGAQVGDVEFADQPADTDVIRAWDSGALPTPVRPAAVEVVSIDPGVTSAASIGAGLSAAGLPVTATSAGTAPADQSETIVQYHPGQLGDGFDVFEKLSGAVVLQSVAAVPAGTVVVQAGSTVAVQAPAARRPAHAQATTPPTTGPATSPTSAPAVTVPTPGGQAPSAATDTLSPWDPRPC